MPSSSLLEMRFLLSMEGTSVMNLLSWNQMLNLVDMMMDLVKVVEELEESRLLSS